MSVIKVEDLSAAYGLNPVLWDIELEIKENTLSAIVGPNGAGKSTLIKCILGFLKPVSGKVTLFNKPLKKVLERIAYVPQHSSVNWDFPISVFDVVLMGRYKHNRLFQRVSKLDKEITADSLKQMNLYELKDRHIADLSGGQKQRVFIARALAQNADLLIMDEPLAGVDKKSEEIIMNKIRDLKENQNKTIICVHHDLNTLNEYFDDVILVNRLIKYHGPIKNMTPDILNATYKERLDV